MTDDNPADPPASDPAVPTRRRALALGAVGVSAVLSIRPALAQTNASVLTCEIPVPDVGRAGSYIAADGSVVPAGTQGAFPGATLPLKGEDVRQAMAIQSSLPGYDSARSQAYLQYVRKLRAGTAGYTCFASLQMPR